ncbi:hypothetical protein ACWEPL_35465 [Nonomuraea sp. NPDC004186]
MSDVPAGPLATKVEAGDQPISAMAARQGLVMSSAPPMPRAEGQ